MAFRSSVSAVINRVGRSALRVRTLKASASHRHELANDPPLNRAPLDDDLLAACRAQPNLVGARIQRELPRGQRLSPMSSCVDRSGSDDRAAASAGKRGGESGKSNLTDLA